MQHVPFGSLAETSAVVTFGTAMSTTSLISNDMMCSGAEPIYGVATSLMPFARGWPSCEVRWTILSRKESSLGSMVEEEKIPVNFSPDLVVMVVCRP